jgi:hypothetical protein
MDVNQDGVLSAEEFIAGMKKRNLTEAQAQQLLALIDANGDGQIELAELLERRHSLSGHASFDTPEPQESVLLQLKHYALGLLWQAPPSLVPENPAQVAALARRHQNGWQYVPGGTEDVKEHVSLLEREISERSARLHDDVEALAATCQEAAMKQREIELTRRDDCAAADVRDALIAHRSMLSQAWMALGGVRARLAPFAGGSWRDLAPAPGAVHRVKRGTRSLLFWVVLYQVAKLLTEHFVMKETRHAADRCLPVNITEVEGLMFSNDDDMLNVMGWRRRALSSTVVERWIAYARPRRNLTTDAEVEALRVGAAGEACSGEGSDEDTVLMAELNAATALLIGVLVALLGWLCRIVHQVVFTNLYLPALVYLFSDPFIFLPMALQLVRLVVILHVYKNLLFNFDDHFAGDAAFIVITVEQLIANVILQSYIMLDIAREKAPTARMLLALSFALSVVYEYRKRRPSAHRSLPHEAGPPTGTFLDDALFTGMAARDALFFIDKTVMFLMLKGIFKTFLRPHHCSFIALVQQLPEAMHQGQLEYSQKLDKGRRRAEAIELLVPHWCWFLHSGKRKSTVGISRSSRRSRHESEPPPVARRPSMRSQMRASSSRSLGGAAPAYSELV